MTVRNAKLAMVDRTDAAIPGIGGWLRGVTGLSYTPDGGILDAIGELKFTIPLNIPRNGKVVPPNHIRVYEDGVRVGTFIVTEKSEAIAPDGLSASYTCPDALFLLQKITPSSGFSAGSTETLATTTLRLAKQDTQRTWTVFSDLFDPVTGTTAYDGIVFSAYGTSVVGAYLKLAGERFSHVKRGVDYSIEFGTFGTDAQFVPGVQARLTMKSGGIFNATLGEREIDADSWKHTKNGVVANDLVPVNNDSGATQLNLRTLYNPVGEVPQADGSTLSGPLSFAGYNPVYPIYKRPNQSGASSDGYDYFIQDTASIAANDLYQEPFPPANISPVKNAAGGVAPADLQLAAVALYQFGVSRLQWAAQPQETIDCTSKGYADVRGFAGKKLRVYVARALPDGTDQVRVDLTPQILKVVVSWADDGTGPTYAWTLSTNGKPVSNFANLVLGKLAQLDQQGYTVNSVETPVYRHLAQNIGPDADLIMHWRAKNNVTQIRYLQAWLTIEGMVHTRDDQGHTQDVITAPTNHDVAANAHDVAFNAAGNYEFGVGGPPFTTAGVAYDPGVHLQLSGGTPPSTAKVVMYDPAGDAFYFQGGGTDKSSSGPFSAKRLSIQGAGPTTDGTGGTVKATTGAADAAAGKPNPGPVGGRIPQTLHRTTDKGTDGKSYGAQKATATTVRVYRDPPPKGVEVWIDGVLRFGPYDTSPGVLDLKPWIDQNAHEIRVKCPNNGAAQFEIEGVIDMTTLAA